MDTSLLDTLKNIPDLHDVPEDQLQWLIDQGTCKTYQTGEYAFKKDEPVENMMIILTGSFSIKVKQGENFRLISQAQAGTITGYLPYSRATAATGYSEANEDSKVLLLPRSKIKEMIHQHDELTTALVHVMSTRIRQFTKMQQQNDKMMALGKLSAGLAHELNNPSAAVVRSARSLKKHLSYLPEHFKQVISIRTDEDTINFVNEMVFNKAEEGIRDLKMNERAAIEDEIAEWLEDAGFEDGYELSENFVDFGFTLHDMDNIKSRLRDDDIKAVINWLSQVLTTEKLVNEIEDASERINKLVTSVKSYTHMDQAPEKHAADIHKGINSTLTMLRHKLDKAGIKVDKEYGELPDVCLYVSEMNQVWTNLIDNAIDAMGQSDQQVLTISTQVENDHARIDITDTGEGIPADIKDQIFDPFFTTKPVGQGTGLGLDVVQQIITQHNGSISVDSKTGQTTFTICLPIT